MYQSRQVPDVGFVTIIVSSVTDNLDTAVGQFDAVLALCLGAVMRLRVGEVISVVTVFDGVREGVVLGRQTLKQTYGDT